MLCEGYHEYDVPCGQFLILVVSATLLSVIGTDIRPKSNDFHRCLGIYSMGPSILILLSERLDSSAFLLSVRDFSYLVIFHIWIIKCDISRKHNFSFVRRHLFARSSLGLIMG